MAQPQTVQERQRSNSFNDLNSRITTTFPRTNSSTDPRNQLSPPILRHDSGGTQSVYNNSSQPTSGRASPALSLSSKSLRHNPSTTSSSRLSFRNPPAPPLAPHSSSSTSIPTATSPGLRNLDSYSSSHVAGALRMEQGENGGNAMGGTSSWEAVCVRVLPLFNGEGLRGNVEDLNQLVSSHIQKTIDRSQGRSTTSHNQPLSPDISSLVTGLLLADLSELLSIGCSTLSTRISPLLPSPPLTSPNFLSRISQLWHFFLTSVLPNLESVFWVLRADQRLRGKLGTAEYNREKREDEGRINVRRLALQAFRDDLIHPEFERLEKLFSYEYVSRPGSSSGGGGGGGGGDSGVDTPSYTSGAGTPFSIPSTRAATPSTQHRVVPSFSSTATIVPSTNSGGGGTPNLTSTTPITSSLTSATQQAAARRYQMIAILTTLQTDDNRQDEMEHLLRSMRSSSASSSRSARAAPHSPHQHQHTEYKPTPPHVTQHQHHPNPMDTPLSEGGNSEWSEVGAAAGPGPGPGVGGGPASLSSSLSSNAILGMIPPFGGAGAGFGMGRSRAGTMGSVEEEGGDNGGDVGGGRRRGWRSRSRSGSRSRSRSRSRVGFFGASGEEEGGGGGGEESTTTTPSAATALTPGTATVKRSHMLSKIASTSSLRMSSLGGG